MACAALFSSGQTRSIQTADIVAEALNLRVQVDPRLSEMDQGEWQGMTFPDIEARYGSLYGRFIENPLKVTPPGGESTQGLARRVSRAADDIARQYPGQRVAIISHELPLAALRCLADRQSLGALWQYAPPNGEVITLGWPVERISWLAMFTDWVQHGWRQAGSD
jgi:broad specificity phosphatase PhoE